VVGSRYDASGWAQAHPGGARWIHWFDGRDATGIFYALHSYGPNGSALAAERLAKLPKCDAPGTAEQRLPKAQEYEDHLEFQQLRVELEEQGYWKREPLKVRERVGVCPTNSLVRSLARSVSLCHTHTHIHTHQRRNGLECRSP
jgi:hypothetical protein